MKYLACLYIIAASFFSSCETVKNLPTNTSGGLFSLNGNWQLASSSDNKALEGTIIRVIPGISDATIKTLGNNTYCLRELDVVWKGLKNASGVFSFDNLVNACNGTSVYKPASMTVVNNDEVKVSSKTAAGVELTQVWKRVPAQ